MWQAVQMEIERRDAYVKAHKTTLMAIVLFITMYKYHIVCLKLMILTLIRILD